MTAPFNPHPPRSLVLFILGSLVLMLAMPFCRLDNWLGRLALLYAGAYGIALWSMLVWGCTRAFIDWRRNRRG